MSLNKVMLIGHVGKIESNSSASGVNYVNFSVATNEKIKDEKVTEWHYCTAFNKTADIITSYCAVGSKVFIEGKIQSSKYRDKDGVEKTSYKIICNNFQMLDSKESNEKKKSSPQESNKEFLDDDIPF